MDRSALLTAQAALLAVRETVVIRKGTTTAFDHALSSIREALTSSCAAEGRPKTVPVHTEYVTTAEAAKLLGCKERWAREIAKRIGIKKSGVWLMSKDALPQEEQ